MNHDYVEEHQIADLYVMGRLEADEEARFEEHYLGCPECLDRIELAEALRDGLHQVAAEEMVKAKVRTAVVQRLGRMAWLARAARSGRLGLVTTALLLILLVPLGVWVQRERARSSELATRLERTLAPQGNVPILTLGAQRSTPESGPVDRVRLPEPPGWIVLSIDLAGADFPGYRGSLLFEGDEVWRGDDLLPDAGGALALSLHSSFLRPGDYELRLEGLPETGDPVPVDRYDFRVLPATP